MTKRLLIAFLPFITVIIISTSVASAPTQLTEEQAVAVIVERIERDKLYASWTKLSCLMFMTEKQTKTYFDFAIHEKHGGECPGDPVTAPIVDRFRVYRLNKKIQWYDVTEGEWHPYKDIKKFREIK